MVVLLCVGKLRSPLQLHSAWSLTGAVMVKTASHSPAFQEHKCSLSLCLHHAFWWPRPESVCRKLNEGMTPGCIIPWGHQCPRLPLGATGFCSSKTLRLWPLRLRNNRIFYNSFLTILEHIFYIFCFVLRSSCLTCTHSP